ncbi:MULTISPECIES: TetR/AcrR family transcriptional regulator [unclassified Phenylobacterium]|uniref:TetR/AcrR family transcriptional regulator n=1 Tax=unclassified Phenylobacterium TaxID=2640670 RepID=UPI003ECFC164
MTEPNKPALRAADKIRETARELFYREGIRAVGVDEIVAKAGATKPSLYRTYKSKDELAAAVLREGADTFWLRFDAAAAEHPGDPRAQVLAYLEGLAERGVQDDYRGCPLSNAAVEYPEHGHPARTTAQDHKAELRERLRGMAAEMGAEDANGLADALLLLIEGAFLTSQLFDEDRPTAEVARAAARLIDAYTR